MKIETVPALTRFSASMLGTFLLIGCGREEIKVYSVPKEAAPVSQMAAAAGQNGVVADPNASPIHWQTPAGWKELAPTSFRVGNFLVSNGDKKAEVSIVPFPGKTGGELDNINRWWREIGLGPATENEVSPETVSIGSDQGKLYDLVGSELQTLAAVLDKDGTSWFFKMRGDKEVVSSNKPAFIELLKSIHFDAGHSHSHAEPTAEAAVSTNVKEIPGESASGEPKWQIPASWQEKAPTPMVLKNFSAGEAGHEAKISITAFPGDVGGALANLNRWRGQLSLPPVAEDEFAKLTTSIDVLGGKATLVDMKGTDAKTGQPARMVAAMVPRQDKTWFYKMTGDDGVVGREKNAFIQFVQSVHYPND